MRSSFIFAVLSMIFVLILPLLAQITGSILKHFESDVESQPKERGIGKPITQ